MTPKVLRRYHVPQRDASLLELRVDKQNLNWRFYNGRNYSAILWIESSPLPSASGGRSAPPPQAIMQVMGQCHADLLLLNLVILAIKKPIVSLSWG